MFQHNIDLSVLGSGLAAARGLNVDFGPTLAWRRIVP
jgi:hypothetical protein